MAAAAALQTAMEPATSTAAATVTTASNTLGGRRPIMDGRDGLKPVHVSKSAPSNRMVTKFLELKCQRHIEAINFRDFYEDSVLHTDASPHWRAEIAVLSAQPMELSDYVAAWRSVAREFPDYGIHCVGMKTDIDFERGVAVVKSELEIEGMPVGVVRRSLGVSTFRLVDGRKWVADKFATVPVARG